MFGLYQLPGSSEPRGGWAWVTGEPVRYAPWSQGQPNDYGGTSHGRFHRFARSASSSVTVDRWDDAPIHLGSTGYIIEIE